MFLNGLWYNRWKPGRYNCLWQGSEPDTPPFETSNWVSHFRPQINADDWTLIIAKTGLLDGGRYECSVNTLPKISHTVELRVEEAEERDLELALADSPVLETWDPLERLEARIQGPRTQYVSEGSTVALQCRSVVIHKLGIYWVFSLSASLTWPGPLTACTGPGTAACSLPRTGPGSPSSRRRLSPCPPASSSSRTSRWRTRPITPASPTSPSPTASSWSSLKVWMETKKSSNGINVLCILALPGYALMFHNSGSGHFRSPGTYLAVIFLSCLCFLSRVWILPPSFLFLCFVIVEESLSKWEIKLELTNSEAA